ncbi:uncharacterized protein LY89DRAFT_508562 [Mollisia scopiformis]|uniref:Uncharacterized protein n=1 Tax=Mollisia scopiformis TaxID=149040 RepID=A0A194XGQ5_MOLSC|nr:uncharacterized protein LY89DRAFT_508562 [Mollisia scopiformis]KUJ18952.1 hypothetical protein LY89DRAFT_508562 [Mollisia scopiformis]
MVPAGSNWKNRPCIATERMDHLGVGCSNLWAEYVPKDLSIEDPFVTTFRTKTIKRATRPGIVLLKYYSSRNKRNFNLAEASTRYEDASRPLIRWWLAYVPASPEARVSPMVYTKKILQRCCVRLALDLESSRRSLLLVLNSCLVGYNRDSLSNFRQPRTQCLEYIGDVCQVCRSVSIV